MTVKFPKHGGIELAQNSWVINLVTETLAADPLVTTAGRIWTNSTTNTINYSVLDGNGVV